MISKNFLGTIIFLLLSPERGQESIIKWSKEYKIQWKDFHGNLQQNTPIAAVSFVGIGQETITQSYDKNLLEVYAAFDANKSLVWMEKTNDSILIHEQNHFNLAEIYARKMRKYLNENAKNYDRTLVYIEVTKLLDLYSDSLSESQRDYDRETEYSRRWDKQKEWILTIRNELKELDKYSSRYVTIYFKRNKLK